MTNTALSAPRPEYQEGGRHMIAVAAALPLLTKKIRMAHGNAFIAEPSPIHAPKYGHSA